MKQNFSDVKFLPPGTRRGLKSLKWTQNGQILTDSKNFFVSNLLARHRERSRSCDSDDDDCSLAELKKRKRKMDDDDDEE